VGENALTCGGGVGRGSGTTISEIPVCPSGFWTFTGSTPGAAVEGTVICAVICVGSLNWQELTVITAPKLQVAPDWKFFPLITTVGDSPRSTSTGVTEVMIGCGAAKTVNLSVRVTLPPSGFVTVTSRRPVAAVAEITIFAVSWSGLWNTQELTVISTPKLHSIPD
jgi:hypothetical protein